MELPDICHRSLHKGVPMRIGALKVFFGIDSTCWCFIRDRDPDWQSGGQRAQLLESLYLLERMRWKRHPPHERFPRVCVHSNMLQCTLGEPRRVGPIAQKRNRRAREVHRPSVIAYYDFHETRSIENLRACVRSRSTKWKPSSFNELSRPTHSSAADEWLIPLNIHDGVVFFKAPLRRGLSNSFRP